MKQLTLWVIFLILLGCQSVEPNKTEISLTELSSPAALMTKNIPFSVSISVPAQVEIIDEFTIKADFRSTTEKELGMMSREELFQYSIRDSSGKELNTFAAVDLGVHRTISGSAIISEEFKFKINKPGIYVVSAIAHFSIDDSEGSKVYHLETNYKQIEVLSKEED